MIDQTSSIVFLLALTFVAGMSVGIWWHVHMEHPWRDFQRMIVEWMKRMASQSGQGE